MTDTKGCLCPVCGRTVFSDSYEICPVCGWENDGGEFDPTRAGGANGCSYYEYRRKFRQNLLITPIYTWEGECDEQKEKKGIFWIVDREDLKNNAPYLFRIPVDIAGTPSALTPIPPLNSKRGDNYNHKLTWECYLPKALRRGKPYYYYPRGRVEIDDRTRAKIYLHPDLVAEPVITYLIEEFLLQKREVIVKADGSKHYSYLAKGKEDMEEDKSTEETFAKKIFKGQKEAVLFRAAEIGEASRDLFRDLRWKMRKRGGYCAFRALWRIGETGWTEDLFVSFGVKGRAALRLAEQYGYPFVTFKEGEACEEYCALPLREQGKGYYGGELLRAFPLQEGDAVLRPLRFGQQGEEVQLVSLWEIEYPSASCYHAAAKLRFRSVFWARGKGEAPLKPAFVGAIMPPADKKVKLRRHVRKNGHRVWYHEIVNQRRTMMSRTCHLCGKQFNFWDERQDFSFSRHIGYGSKYDRTDIALNLCCHCFDKVMDRLLPQCAVDPVCRERGEGLPIKALLEGDFVAEAESLMRSLPVTQHLSYGFRRMWLREWQGVYVVRGMGYCTDPYIRLPRSIVMTSTYGDEKQVHHVSVGEVGKRAFACERRLEGAVLTAVSEIGAEAFDECCSLRWLWLPRNLCWIGPAAFRGCKNFEAIFFEGTEEEFKKIVADTAQKEVFSPDKGLTFEGYEVKHLGNEPFLNAKVYYNFPFVKSRIESSAQAEGGKG